MSLQDKMKRDEQNEHATVGSGGFYKLQEGENKLRVLDEPEAIFKDYKLGICYTDCRFKGNMKYLCHVFDYRDKEVKLFEMPLTIFKVVATYESDDDYHFDGFPMPYDIKINAKNAGTKEVEYTVSPARQNTPLPEEATKGMGKSRKISDIIEAMQDKNKKRHESDGTWARLHDGAAQEERPTSKGFQYPADDINPDDIPFN